MEVFHIISAILIISAVFAYINQQYIKLPGAIGLLLAGLLLSVLVQGAGAVSPQFEALVEERLMALDFSEFLLEFMLSFLLFAGALHTDLEKLRESKWPILVFATVGVMISTFVTGTIFYYLMQFLGNPIGYIYCLLFGALISPTDPIAVLGILKKANIPKSLEVSITGESLFNDGVGVVVFLAIFQIAQLGFANVEGSFVAELFVMEVGGGIGLGLLIGYIAFHFMRRIDHYQTEVIISLAVVMGGYSIAQIFHFSGPLAMVAAGLLIGNQGTKLAMSEQTADYLTKFWEMVDEIMNAVLFVLIGLELMVVEFRWEYAVIGLITTGIVLAVRYFALAVPSYTLGLHRTFAPGALSIMTWGGLRGGISIALALSLTNDMFRDEIVAITYTVVLMSLVVQGLTIEPFIKRVSRRVGV
ncbi:cation:proton antiporter [Pontibacter anaerobius]|uniref:Sodium:proton antiporter n=1 Tax=Pontibacter anaerobius TaxID=2993940 RepID=A0ABT3RCP2_9BACT|nr:sodium:proton antiporter [Pontibacter anaerobius]MCX2739619.1 sodium:proton antiporter [Pontibacter anaerobius]